jgi:hypothetical protein
MLVIRKENLEYNDNGKYKLTRKKSLYKNGK